VVQQHVSCWRAFGFFSFYFLAGRNEGLFLGLKTEAEFWKILSVLQVGGEANLTDIVVASSGPQPNTHAHTDTKIPMSPAQVSLMVFTD
jgi:hypothetical protein